MTTEAPPEAHKTSPKAGFSEGDLIGEGYRLTERLPWPAAEEVWAAREEGTGAEVELHFLPAKLAADPVAMRELLLEIRQSRQIIHPRIARIHGLVEQEGAMAIAMDRLPGESVATLLRRQAGGRFEAGEIVNWVTELCEALDDAHRAGVIHGGLTPWNIYLTEEGKVPVACMGVSRSLDAARGRAEEAYRSPQQVAGEVSGRLDDVYSMGAVLFELLTGESPVRGARAVSGEGPELARGRGGEILRAEIRDITPQANLERRGSQGDLSQAPHSWEKAVEKCLKTRPADRPATLRDLAALLARNGQTALYQAVSSAPPRQAAASEAVRIPVTLVTEPRKGSAPPARSRYLGATICLLVVAIAAGGYLLTRDEARQGGAGGAPIGTQTPLEAPAPLAAVTGGETKSAPAAVMPLQMATVAKESGSAAAAARTGDPELDRLSQAVSDQAGKVEALRRSLEAAAKNRDELVRQKETADAEARDTLKAAFDKKQTAAAAAKAVAESEAARQQSEAALKRALDEASQTEAALEKRKAEMQTAQKVTPSQSPLAATAGASGTVATVAVGGTSAQSPVAAPMPLAAAEPAKKPVTQPVAAKGTPIEMASLAPIPSTAAAAKSSAASTPAAEATGTWKPLANSRVDAKLENTLGMKFAPVGDILFSVWDTRVEDFEVFAKATGYKPSAWKQPGFTQAPDHPVVNVSWQTAAAFCKWLTEKERRDGWISAEEGYRLPTDQEWSMGVGLPPEAGATPEARDMDVPDVYPWGTQWPPPPGAGNYTGQETGSDVAIAGYDDGYAWTSPVGSFAPNRYGLYDMGGNVWQWCMDWWNGEQKQKVLRGASWYNGGLKLSLLSSSRDRGGPESYSDNFGFRVVLAPLKAKAEKK